MSSSLNAPQPFTVDSAVETYNNVLSDLFDKHAPVKNCTIAVREQQPWINDTIRSAKRLKRKLEIRWRKSKLTVHQIAYKEQCYNYNELIKAAKKKYFI